jgi:acyl carrier protein
MPLKPMSPREQLHHLIAEVFDADISTISSETSRDDLEKWDSMGTIDLVAQLEKHYSVTFDLLEVEDLHHVGIIEECLKEKGVELS